MLRVLAEGEDAVGMDMLDEELVQPLLEGDILEPSHGGTLQKI